MEIVSPDDETRLKFSFYHRVGVEELLIVDPLARTVEWLVRGADGFVPAPGGARLDLPAAELVADVEWPA